LRRVKNLFLGTAEIFLRKLYLSISRWRSPPPAPERPWRRLRQPPVASVSTSQPSPPSWPTQICSPSSESSRSSAAALIGSKREPRRARFVAKHDGGWICCRTAIAELGGDRIEGGRRNTYFPSSVVISLVCDWQPRLESSEPLRRLPNVLQPRRPCQPSCNFDNSSTLLADVLTSSALQVYDNFTSWVVFLLFSFWFVFCQSNSA
jgi:hypothetical protein